MKTQHFTLSIPEPCSKAWEQMTPCGSGKFCNSCQKTVIDFTDYSEAQIAAFFADKRGESVCGRFYAAQIEEAVFSYVAPAQKSYRTLAMAASVAVLTVLSFTADGQNSFPGITSPQREQEYANVSKTLITDVPEDSSKNSKTLKMGCDSFSQDNSQSKGEDKVLLIGATISEPVIIIGENQLNDQPERPLLQIPSNKTYTGEEWDRLQKSVQDSAGQ